jgi:large subunit ribosomal protein L6
MSRIGKQPIQIPTNVQITENDGFIVVKGPKGELTRQLHPQVKMTMDDGVLKFSVQDETDKKQCALWGLYRNLVNNMVIGVTDGFTRQLEINGVGFKAEVGVGKLTLNVGFSHPVVFPIAAGVNVVVAKNIITLTGIDKDLLGQVAANIRKIKKPEPYNGKGIKYVEEVIRRKAGKSVTKSE